MTDIQDIIFIMNKIENGSLIPVGKNEKFSKYSEMDIDGDGYISIFDITSIIRIVLNSSETSTDDKNKLQAYLTKFSNRNSSLEQRITLDSEIRNNRTNKATKANKAFNTAKKHLEKIKEKNKKIKLENQIQVNLINNYTLEEIYDMVNSWNQEFISMAQSLQDGVIPPALTKYVKDKNGASQ